MINVNNSGDVHELHFPKLMDKKEPTRYSRMEDKND